MNFRSRNQEELDLNLTPLIDVVFLLLIFFMVTTTFNRETELKIELPEAKGATPEVEQVLEISVNAQGRYFVNQQEVINTNPETLMKALREAVGDQKDPPVLISADGQASHQSVMTILDVSQQLGLVHITFAANEPKPESKP